MFLQDQGCPDDSAAFPVSYIVLTFQVALIETVRGKNRFIGGLYHVKRSLLGRFRLSVGVFVVSVSVAGMFFYVVRVLASRTTLLLSHPGLGPAMAELLGYLRKP